MSATRSKPTLPRRAESLGKLGVLVIDDDHLIRIMLRSGLERNGFEVWLASDADEAIEFYREHRDQVSVVLLDVRMPGQDGPQVLQALRKLNPEIRACFMSGDTGGLRTEDLIACGADCVMAKPFLLNDLADTLRQVARRHPAEFERTHNPKLR